MFEYQNREPGSHSVSAAASSATRPSDDGPGSFPIGSPERCISRCRRVIGPYPPPTWNHGRWPTRGSSSEIAPSASSWSAQIAANDFEIDPIWSR